VKIVLSRLDRVGDLILSTPAIASVRRSWPDAEITLACSRYNAVVVAKNPDIDRVIPIPSDVKPAVFGERFRGECDIAIALAPRQPDFELVGATRAKVRVGYTYVRRYLARLTARLFLTKFAISEADPELCEKRSTHRVRHEVEQVLDLVALAGGGVRFEDLVVPVDDADEAAVADIPAGGIAFHVAPRWFRDGSTLESMLATMHDLRRFGVPLVATYGDDVREQIGAVRAAGAADAVVGDLAFSRWAAVLRKSRLVVTVDTGATHVASAMKRPTAVVFEHRYFHLNSQEWSPYRVPSRSLRKPAGDSDAELAALRASIVEAVGDLLAESSGA
jgi:ADP-heptose:LPS heptosyltransferase